MFQNQSQNQINKNVNKAKKIIFIESLKNQQVIADQCFVAESFFDRLRGLMGRKKLEQGEGMWFGACNNIHMWFMSIPIDVLFLKRSSGEQYQIVSVRTNLRPWRLLPVWGPGATETVELPVGTIEKFQLKAGDMMRRSNV